MSDGEDEEELKPQTRAYAALLQSFHAADHQEHRNKRRKIQRTEETMTDNVDSAAGSDVNVDSDSAADESEMDEADEEEDAADLDDDDENDDPFDHHFANPDESDLAARLENIRANKWDMQKSEAVGGLNRVTSFPAGKPARCLKMGSNGWKDLKIKERLQKNLGSAVSVSGDFERSVAASMFSYSDLLLGNRTVRNASSMRSLACLHAVNHVLKGRDRVLKNNERLKQTEDSEQVEYRDQGFVRPKVLILLETRQMAARYVETISKIFQPDQQENRKRFDDSFSAPLEDREDMPEDYRETFDGNNDNSFLTALKFTRKNLKLFSAFYNSDIIVASPLGLRRVIENEDLKKKDHDFLSSIEIAVVDQADAMQMQSWENVEVVFKHLNLQLKESHGCDFSRVRTWYLDELAKYFRQTIVFSAYVTPEINRLYNTSMLNHNGKVKITPVYLGAIANLTGLGIRQIFSRFDCSSPAADPDARFKYFTTAVLPALLRLPKPADGVPGILLFVPSYFDFLRLRNYFATSTATENISFGTIHDYSEVSDQRRARSHFASGRHSILIYTQRAHHFFRLKIRGVKRVVMYGVPDNEIFYQEFVEGFLGTSINDGKITEKEASVRSLFSKWDGLKMERIVGSSRVRGCLAGVGDTFEFV